MITDLIIQHPEYHNFSLHKLTKNNIFIFSSPELKNRVAEEIEKLWLLPDDDDDSVLYRTDSVVPALDTTKENLRSPLTTIAQLSDGQRFVFTVEPAFIYAATDWYDIWFVTDQNGVIECHAFCEFVGSSEVWSLGLDSIYTNFISGKYGCYKGYKNLKTTTKGEYALCRE